MSGGNFLSAGQAALVLFGVFIGLLIVRVPVAFALGLACLPILLIEPRLSMMMLAQETFNAYNSFILLSVPFFLLTANLMSIGGITDRLVALSRAMVGHWPGSLAQINVVLSVFFAGISGSSTADAASQSKIFIDAHGRALAIPHAIDDEARTENTVAAGKNSRSGRHKTLRIDCDQAAGREFDFVFGR